MASKRSYCERHGCDHQPIAYSVASRLPVMLQCLHCQKLLQMKVIDGITTFVQEG